MPDDQVWLTVGVLVHPKSAVWIRSLCRPVRNHTNWGKAFLYRAGFVHLDAVMLKQERAFPKPLPCVVSQCSTQKRLFGLKACGHPWLPYVERGVHILLTKVVIQANTMMSPLLVAAVNIQYVIMQRRGLIGSQKTVSCDQASPLPSFSSPSTAKLNSL